MKPSNRDAFAYLKKSKVVRLDRLTTMYGKKDVSVLLALYPYEVMTIGQYVVYMPHWKGERNDVWHGDVATKLVEMLLEKWK